MKIDKKILVLIVVGLCAIWYFLGTETTGATAAILALSQRTVNKAKAKRTKQRETEQEIDPLREMGDELRAARQKKREEKEKWLDRQF